VDILRTYVWQRKSKWLVGGCLQGSLDVFVALLQICRAFLWIFCGHTFGKGNQSGG